MSKKQPQRWKLFDPTKHKPADDETPNVVPPVRESRRKIFRPGVDVVNETPEEERPPLPPAPHDATVLEKSNETYPERVRAGQRQAMLERDPHVFDPALGPEVPSHLWADWSEARHGKIPF